ncbi:hypothetical protein TYRP_008798 [Tyrophagus putrescentiae]|nr:hypothetical protein TYRP_008798 [Tyrophagus putrescentiae]
MDKQRGQAIANQQLTQFSIAVRHSSRPSVGERAQDTVGSRHRSVCTGTFVWSGRIRHHHQHRCCPR